MARAAADDRRWMDEGTELFERALAAVDDAQLAEPLALDGWTGRHLLAHVAANADALVNLVQWAETGVETPMYATPQQRNEDIEVGAKRPTGQLREWFVESAEAFARRYDALDEQQRGRDVRTAQGRSVPASEVTWMRAREVMVHAVDLGGPVTFADLPEHFLVALVEDVATKRSKGGDGPTLRVGATDADLDVEVPGTGDPSEITGPLADVTAYLTGRPGARVTTADGPVPELPPWL